MHLFSKYLEENVRSEKIAREKTNNCYPAEPVKIIVKLAVERKKKYT